MAVAEDVTEPGDLASQTINQPVEGGQGEATMASPAGGERGGAAAAGELPALLWSEPPEPASEIQPRNLAGCFSPVSSPVPMSINPCTTSKRFPATAHKRRLHCVASSLALAGSGEKVTQRMQVVLRVRPLAVKSAPEWTSQICLHANSETTIAIVPPEKSQGYKNGDRGQTYGFSRVFESETSQAQYYSSTTSQLVSDLVQTRSAHTSVLMAYGITASGKTHTIEGTRSDPGVLPRGMTQLFQEIQAQEDAAQLQVLVSHYEVYNEQVHDLLCEDVPGASKPSLRIKEDAKGHIHVAGLTKVLVRTHDEAMDVLRRGSKNRHKGGTALNHQSSRSHSIFTISLSKIQAQAKDSDLPSPKKRLGQLSFVDLAGAERANRTGNAGARLKESVAINSSLMTLGRCMEALRWNQQHSSAEPKLVPYRESKVTHIFRDVLHGWGRLVLSVSVSPSAADYDETHNVLKYAQMATQISQLAKAELPARPQPRNGAPACAGTAQKRRRLNNARLAEEPARLEIRQTLAKGAPDAEAARRAAELIEQLEDSLLDVRAENRSLQEEVGHLTEQLQEAKQEAASIETRVREEVSDEMGSLLSKMDSRYKEREADIRSKLESQYATQLEQAEKACQAKSSAQGDAGPCSMDANSPAAGKEALHELQKKLSESTSRTSELQSQLDLLSEENRVIRNTAEEEQLKAKHATDAICKLEASWREKFAQAEVDFAAQAELKLKLLEQRHKNGEESLTEGWQERLTQQEANAAAEVQMLDDQMQRQLDANAKIRRRVQVLSDIVDSFNDCRCGLAHNPRAGRGTPASDVEEEDRADPGTPHAIALQRALSAVAKEAQRPSLGPASASPAPAPTRQASVCLPTRAAATCGPEDEARQSLMRSSQLLSRLQGARRSSLMDEMPSCMKALRAGCGSPVSEPDGDWDEPNTSPVVLDEDVRASTGVFTGRSFQPQPMGTEPLRASAPQLEQWDPEEDQSEGEEQKEAAPQQLSLHSSLKNLPGQTPVHEPLQQRDAVAESGEHPAVSALKANMEKIRKKRRLSRVQKELAWASEINEDEYYKAPSRPGTNEQAPAPESRQAAAAGGRRRSSRVVARSTSMSASGCEDSYLASLKDQPVRRTRKSTASSGCQGSSRSRKQPVDKASDGLEAILEDCEAAQSQVPSLHRKMREIGPSTEDGKASLNCQVDKENTPNGNTPSRSRTAQRSASSVDAADMPLQAVGQTSKPRRRKLGKGTALLSVTSELNEESADDVRGHRASRRV